MNRSIYYPPVAFSNLLKTIAFTVLLAFFNVAGTAQSVLSCTADAGDFIASQVCFQNGQVTLKATPKGNSVVPRGFQVLYVLTKGNQLVIQQVASTPVFNLPDSATGLYTLHTLVFDSATLDLNTIQIGETTGFDVNALFLQGGGIICGSLDVVGTKFSLGSCEDACVASAGKLAASSSTCLRDGKATIIAKVQTAPIVPPGYTRLYVLTSGAQLVIEGVSSTPSFVVDSSGRFTIHTLVYDSSTLNLGIVQFGVTTAATVNGLLVQGGGNICAALDLTGARFDVRVCPPACTARAGSLRSDSDNCLQEGRATLKAKIFASPTVPAGYQVRYVLTSGYGLVIQQISTTPSFVVTAENLYRIHTLVYDPATLNLSSIQLGHTSANEVNRLLIQGGGSICAALDLTGVYFEVKVCPCYVKAGSLRPDTNYPTPCLENGKATLRATVVQHPYVQQGYQVRYVLTSGEGLVIEQVSTTPSFMVTRTGRFTIHTLVYDPNTLNLNSIVLGITTGFEINKLLIQGGGRICGALDVYGAIFSVRDCPRPCDARAGRLAADNDPCLRNDTATVKAKVIQAPVVPTGYQVLYVLTSGTNLVIRAVSTTPSFVVATEGRYTIHTLVYNPTTLNLNTIQIGVTTGFEVNRLLIQGGGTICAALDVTGAPFLIEKCVITCPAKAGKLTARILNPCLVGGKVTLVGTTLVRPTVPARYQVAYVLTSGDGLVIEAVNELPSFEVKRAGKFTIHTLVYNPATLVLDRIVIGTTTGVEVFKLTEEGGGTLCASLELPGLIFQVRNCNTLQNNSVNAYPNPTNGVVNLNFQSRNQANDITVQVLDLAGNILRTWTFAGDAANATIDLQEMSAGMYNVRILYDAQNVENIRVAKVTE